jgi:hypothetical protein
MSIWDHVTRIVVNDGRQRQPGARVRLVRTSLNPPYELLEATPLRIRGMKLLRVVLLPLEAEQTSPSLTAITTASSAALAALGPVLAPSPGRLGRTDPRFSRPL